MKPIANTKQLSIAPSVLLAGAVLISSACTTTNRASPRADVIAKGDSKFCTIARDKASHLGEDLVLRGSYVTDLRHYSLLKATCDGKDIGFSLGVGPAELSLSDPRVRKKCEVACHIVVDAVVTGKLVKRDGGIELDFSKLSLPNDLEH